MKPRDGLFLFAILAPATTYAATLETLATVLAIPADKSPMEASPSAQWSSIGKISDIKWRDREPRPRGRDYIRAGSVPLQGLGTTSITWEGNSDAAFTADLRTGTRLSPDKYAGMLKEQFSSNVKLRAVRGGCKDQQQANSAIYEATIPGKRPVFFLVNTVPNWNNGNSTIQVSANNEPSWSC
jgi:hypothetical protein